MLTYDAETTLVLLHDGSKALLVDASLCVNAEVLGKGRKDSRGWASERKSYVWVVGYLERVDAELPIPMFPAYLAQPEIDPSLVVRAVMIAPATGEFSTRRVREVLSGMAGLPPLSYPECTDGQT